MRNFYCQIFDFPWFYIQEFLPIIIKKSNITLPPLLNVLSSVFSGQSYHWPVLGTYSGHFMESDPAIASQTLRAKNVVSSVSGKTLLCSTLSPTLVCMLSRFRCVETSAMLMRIWWATLPMALSSESLSTKICSSPPIFDAWCVRIPRFSIASSANAVLMEMKSCCLRCPADPDTCGKKRTHLSRCKSSICPRLIGRSFSPGTRCSFQSLRCQTKLRPTGHWEIG